MYRIIGLPVIGDVITQFWVIPQKSISFSKLKIKK
jgi:hypothetical protein